MSAATSPSPSTSDLLRGPTDYSALGFPTSVAQVEKALKKLWEDDHASTKATLINLVILSTRAGSLLENNTLAVGLTHDHACRVLLIEASGNETGVPVEPQAWITAHCHLSSGRKSICSEQIAFILDGQRPGLIRNTLLANLLSDLPVILWWQGCLDSTFEAGLFQNIDRFIVDSTSWPLASLAAQHERLLAAQRQMVQPFSIHDIAWAKTYQFRIAVAALFDHPQAFEVLPQINSGEVVVGCGHLAAAHFLIAWAANAAGWQLTGHQSDVNHTWQFLSPAGHTVAITCSEDPSSAPIGKITLRCPKGLVEVTRKPGDNHLNAHIELCAPQAPIVLPADPDDSGSLVASLLSRGGKYSLYASVLPVFLAMANYIAQPDKQELP